MKGAACLGVMLLALAGASFVDFLNSIQSHHSFQRLPSEEKLLFGQLVVAAENDELTEFIDRVGMVPVLKLMDHMSHYDAEKFAAYLAEHTNYTHHSPDHGDVIHRRDNDNDEDEDHHHNLRHYLQSMHSGYYTTLPEAEKKTFDAMVHAASSHTVSQFIDTVGYGPVFGLLEHLDDKHSDDVTRLLELALAAENGAAQPVRREDSHSSHHSNFFSHLQDLNNMYFEHLPDEERQVYHDLTAAATAHNITGYIDTHGYGPIFGFIEHLDYYHAQQTYAYLTKALETEMAQANP